MKRIFPSFVFAVALLFSFSSSLLHASTGGACPSDVTGPSSCYFVAANGADSNAGTSEASPWLHAPGMPTCSATCAATTPVPGNGFIFRGGDTWHFGASTSPATGGEWQWTWSGSSANCNYPSATSSCVYIGVDKTWYSGSSWARPIMNLDNPIWANSTHQDSSHNGFVTACSYEDHAFIAVYLNANYVQLDNFEFLGKCWNTLPTYTKDSEITRSGQYIAITNSYFHGWTETFSPQQDGKNPMDQATILSSYPSGITHNTIAYNVFDGSDTICTGSGNCTGGPVAYGDAYYYYGNVCRYIATCLSSPNNMVAIHDNLFEYVYESYDPADHGAVIESYGTTKGISNMSIYNNIIRNTNIGVTLNPGPPDSGTVYVFNNVFWNNANAGNCIAFENNTPAAGSFYVVNNTFDAPCTVRFTSSQGPDAVNGTAYFKNNHFIGYSQQALSSVWSADAGTTVTVTDNGNEIFQTESVANAQGYTHGNNYAPTSSSGATVGAGANLTTSCSSFSSDSALCSGTSGSVTDGSGTTALYPAIPIVPRAPNSGPNWDAGAYLFGTAVSAPTNLAAVVH